MKKLDRQRWRLLHRINEWLETPLLLLAIVWLLLLIIDLTQGLSRPLTVISNVIWGIFVVEFAFRLLVAPRRILFLKRNWLNAISLALPAFRVLRVARVLRAARGLHFVRVLTSVNRSMRALGKTMQRRGVPYVTALTLIVLFTGAAGMYVFEKGNGARGFSSYAESLWWTAMLLTTIGSEYWPRTTEGRALALALSLYAIAILGYIAAVLATFFIGRDAESKESALASEESVRELNRRLAILNGKLDTTQDGPA